MKILTSIQNGIFKRNRNLVLDLIRSFDGKEVFISIERVKKKRSNNQNRYLWGVLYPITKEAIKNEWGEIWSNEKVHDFYKLHFNYIEKVNETTGEVIKISKSTTENTTTQQEDFHSQILNFLKEWFNIDAPLPNEVIEISFDR